MRKWIQLIIGLSGVFSTLVFSQVTPQTIQPFKSLCISDEEIGLNWTNDKWITAKFTLDKYILEKLDYEKAMKSTNIIDRPLLCSTPSATTDVTVKACYSIKKFGTVFSNVLIAGDCYESFKGESIELIQCPSRGNFKPNGLFVKLPSHISMDLSLKKEKDSIVLAVGTCGVL